MNHSTLLQSSFPLDCSGTSDSDYGTQRHFPAPSGFPTDDEENNRRVGALGHPLAQPVSIPATNGLRYSAQQSAMQDVPFPPSPTTILLSPTDSCSEAFSSGSNSVYSPSAGYHFDRMPDFRSHRVPPLQPPAGMPPSLQSQSTAITAASNLIGRADTYSPGYTLRGSSFPSLSGLNEMSRFSQYTTTPRGLGDTIDRSQNLMFGHGGNVLMEPVQRLPQSMADAPPFNETNVLQAIVTSTSQPIKPEIQAKIHKGFFQVDEKWTCYRRNYFSVSCSFSLRPWTSSAPLYLKFPDQSTDRIRSFAMSISAIVNAQYGEVRELVQHTPKRDKQSERKPGKVAVQPSQPPPLVLSHGSSSTGSHLGFGMNSLSTGMTVDYNSSYTSTPQPAQPPTQHTFERIQFQKATANNGKRRAQQQYYNLVVELYAEVGGNEPQWVKVARKLSHPMVVRGRSPGHYKDGRRDSTTSMGPDGGSGAPGDGNGGAVLAQGIGQAARSHLALMSSYDTSQRGSHYGRTDYRQMSATDQSPLSGSPLISSSSSSAFDITVLNDSMDPMDTIKSGSSIDSYQDQAFAVTSPDGRKPEPLALFRNQLPPFEYDSPAKDHEEPSNSFPEAFDSIISMSMHNDQEESSHYLKQPHRLSTHRQPGTSGYDPIYGTRTGDSSSYTRFDPIQNPQSLCT